MNIIKRNAIRCKWCGDIIESKSVHDFQQCSCGSCSCDGGHDYVRLGGKPEDYEMLTEYEEVPGYWVENWPRYGGYHKFLTDKDPNEIVHIFEDMWDYIRISDEEGNFIYQTRGLEKRIGEG